jgi:hypothetical protein
MRPSQLVMVTKVEVGDATVTSLGVGAVFSITRNQLICSPAYVHGYLPDGEGAALITPIA